MIIIISKYTCRAISKERADVKLEGDLPGYGTCPWVVSSTKRIPYDQTSDFIVNLWYIAASGAVHLIGNFVPVIEK